MSAIVLGVTRFALLSLERSINCSWVAVKEAGTSNRLNRAVGIGAQGLADVFALLQIPFDSVEAAVINKKIFEHIYYAGEWQHVYLATILIFRFNNTIATRGHSS